MKRIVLNIEEASGAISDDVGTYIGILANGKFEDFKDNSVDIPELIKLGVTTDEIIKLKNFDLI